MRERGSECEFLRLQQNVANQMTEAAGPAHTDETASFTQILSHEQLRHCLAFLSRDFANETGFSSQAKCSRDNWKALTRNRNAHKQNCNDQVTRAASILKTQSINADGCPPPYVQVDSRPVQGVRRHNKIKMREAVFERIYFTLVTKNNNCTALTV